MNEKSIRNLKNKFTFISLASFFVVMTFVAGLIYLFNGLLTRSQIRGSLEIIAANEGILPEDIADIDVGPDEGAAGASYDDAAAGESFEVMPEDTQDSSAAYNPSNETSNAGSPINRDGIARFIDNIFGIREEFFLDEFYYSTRYFAVLYSEQGVIESVITSHIAALGEEEAIRYAEELKNRFFDFGNDERYYYLVSARESGGEIVVVMDCSAQVSANRRIFGISLTLIIIGMLISAVVIRSSASLLIRPEIKNAELQKTFITNASHELKTPLAAIRANTEMLEMTGVSNEWTQSTLRQVDRLTGLVQNLILVTKANEQVGTGECVSMDFSAILCETVSSFEPVALGEKKELTTQISPGITMKAAEGDLRQIASVLIDNAIKYCDDKGKIKVGLNADKKARKITLYVSNSYAKGKDVDYEKFFDRFYRGDAAHNTDKEGYGVGLSIAQALTERYHGTIKVTWHEGVITFTVRLSGT